MKIAALISGGVDSAVAVHRLLEQGHDPHLFYIRIGLDNDEGDCSAEEDIEMCTYIARRYNLPFDVVSLHQEYWDNVMEYALRTVREGLTPNPDIMCNRMIKFGYFEQRWGHEFDMTATGHYATTTRVGDKVYLSTAVDPVKDQTDFLARISYEQLCHVMFPIGDLPKQRVREIALATHMPNALRKDSQGICFLGKINYNDFIRRHLGERPGPIVEIETGRKLGEHRGYWFHTIGQRKGLEIALGKPAYVLKINPQKNTVMLGDAEQLKTGYMLAEHENLVDEGEFFESKELTVRIRYRSKPIPCDVKRLEDGRLLVHFQTEASAIAPGQSAVFYIGRRVVGGSFIASQRGIGMFL